MQTIELTPATEPRATLVILHGLGADGTDVLPMCDALDLDAVGPMRFLMPRAPERAVTINGGARMRAWYDIRAADITAREDEGGLRESFALVHALLDREVSRGIPAERIVLAGFSQGCAIALGAGLRFAERLAGIAGMSGYLPLPVATARERAEANATLPIFLGHGRNDEVVPMSRGAASRDTLAALGAQVEWHDYPMAHSVSMEEIADLNRWLLEVLA